MARAVIAAPRWRHRPRLVSASLQRFAVHSPALPHRRAPCAGTACPCGGRTSPSLRLPSALDGVVSAVIPDDPGRAGSRTTSCSGRDLPAGRRRAAVRAGGDGVRPARAAGRRRAARAGRGGHRHPDAADGQGRGIQAAAWLRSTGRRGRRGAHPVDQPGYALALLERGSADAPTAEERWPAWTSCDAIRTVADGGSVIDLRSWTSSSGPGPIRRPQLTPDPRSRRSWPRWPRARTMPRSPPR